MDTVDKYEHGMEAMTHDAIVRMCDEVMSAKGKDYASPTDRWSNFHQASGYSQDFGNWTDSLHLALSPKDCVVAFALKHYESCMAIRKSGVLDPVRVMEKAGDLLNYYLIWRCLDENLIVPKTDQWLTELAVTNKRWESKPWIIGYDLLEEL